VSKGSDQFAKLKADPQRYARYKSRMRAAWKRYALRHSISERRAERYFRNRGRRREEEGNFRFAGLAIVNADKLANDRTRFAHPGARRESELEKLADEILKKSGHVKPA